MADGVSFLGFGSDTKLNADLIKKLRAADEGVMLKPIEKKIDENAQRKDDFVALRDSLKALQQTASVFSDELTYLQRAATSSGSGGTVSTEAGVNPQSGKISVIQLAQKSVMQSKGFDNEDAIIGPDGGTTLKLKLGPDEFEIDVPEGMSLGELRSKIAEKTDGAIEASILNTGGDSGYRLILKSKDSGDDNNIEVETTDDFDLGFETIQKGQDAKFVFNGVNIQRPTNTVDDLIMGVTFKLEKAGEDINYTISQDLSQMTDKFKEFVDVYNQIVDILDTATGFDEETKESGSFQGDSRVTTIRSSLTNILFSIPSSNESITEYGLEINKKGKLVFDEEEFQQKLSEDPTAFENLFRGKNDITEAMLVGNKVGYNYEEITTINADGSVSTSYEYTPITEDITLPKGSVKINGVELPEITLLASNTPAENTQLLQKAINSISEKTGVSASLSGGKDKIILTNSSGGDIVVSDSTDDAKKYLGLNDTRTSGSVEYTDGLFSKFDDYLDSLLDGEYASLNLLGQTLDKEAQRLEDSKKSIIERLDQRYHTMEEQFASYNTVINQMQKSFDSLKMQIDFQTAKK